MANLIAKLRENAAREMEYSGTATYTIFTDEPEYPYSLGYLKFTKATGEWTVYCMSRSDIGMALVDTTNFDNRGAALAFVRAKYDEAMIDYEARCAQVRAVLNEGLSDIRFTGWFRGYAFPQPERIAVAIIEPGKPSFTMNLTMREALTALDYLYARSEGRFVVGDLGRIMASTGYVHNRNPYTKWIVPAGATDYQIEGWASTTGEGRRKTDAFYAALYRRAA